MNKINYISGVFALSFIVFAPTVVFGAIDAHGESVQSETKNQETVTSSNENNINRHDTDEDPVVTTINDDDLDHTRSFDDGVILPFSIGVVDTSVGTDNKDDGENTPGGTSGGIGGYNPDIDILSGSINEDSVDEDPEDEEKETSASNQGERVTTPEYGAGKDNSVSINAREVRGWDPDEKKEFLETVKEHAQVQSGQDLENFAKGVLLNDENIKSIEVSENKVRIEYKTPAKFLGIFNSSLAVRAEVSEVEKAKVKFPWYGFLFKKAISTNDIESKVEASLPEIDDEVLVSFESQAKVLIIISNVLKTKHDTVKNIINNIR